jgi:IclR family transcriptional regulator, mhp operon transcriptional activator
VPEVRDKTYTEVRGLIRGLAVLRALNAMAGATACISELARATGLHRTTVKRLLETLRLEDCVLQKDDGSTYTLGYGVRRLSEGYVAAEWIDQIAAPAMQAHLRDLSWPTNIATPDNGFMVVRESTHRASLLSFHRATIGMVVPILFSAIGRAWLAWCTEEERNATLTLLKNRNDHIGEVARDSTYVQHILQETRERGYALNCGEWSAEANVTGIGFPIFMNNRAIAAINMVLQSNLISQQEITTRLAPQMHALAQEISDGIARHEHA